MLGKGTLTYAHGDVYRGEWECDQESGLGRMLFASKDQYKGEFSNGLMHGQGEFTYKEDGSKYTGSFEEGEFKYVVELTSYNDNNIKR
jgi:hypothetical protein